MANFWMLDGNQWYVNSWRKLNSSWHRRMWCKFACGQIEKKRYHCALYSLCAFFFFFVWFPLSRRLLFCVRTDKFISLTFSNDTTRQDHFYQTFDSMVHIICRIHISFFIILFSTLFFCCTAVAHLIKFNLIEMCMWCALLSFWIDEARWKTKETKNK